MEKKLYEIKYNKILKTKTPNELLKTSFINLDNVGVEHALVHGASKITYKELSEMKKWFLDLIADLEEVKSPIYPKSIFWKKSGIILFEYNKEYKCLYVSSKYIWLFFEKLYKLDYNDIELFIKNVVNEYLNWNNFTTGDVSFYNIGLFNKI